MCADGQRHAWVYILASRGRGTLYIGVTTNLQSRVWQHKNGTYEGFTKRYRVLRLVYFEPFAGIQKAIERERALKGWRRERKIALVEAANPTWTDLAAGWFR